MCLQAALRGGRVGRVYLVATSADYAQELALDSGTAWTIGRSSDNTLVCPDKSMSRRHAVIEQMQPGRFYFVDLGSSNGSALNGRRITVPIELRDGDAVQCGATVVTFYAAAEESGGPAKEADNGTELLPSPPINTVLVADIRDFTQLARQLDEAVLAQTLGTWFRHAGTIVRRHGASEDKYLGDAVIALWTHSNGNPAAAEICGILKALLELEAFTRALHQQFPLPAPLRIGAGVNTGHPVRSGIEPQRTSDHNALDAMGGAGFRLEAAAKKSGFDVALGNGTIECLLGAGDIRQYSTRQSVELTGCAQAMEVWFTSFARLRTFLAACDEDKG
jgi:adenylate cyclase